jgi:cyclopropane fatty-acyl-phospholipid synthase-like methyltransferase
MNNSVYVDGSYRHNNPDWHAVDSGWKADRIASILVKNSVEFESCIEVGCGAGQILARLALQFPGKSFSGYDISPDVADLWSSLPPGTVSYHCADFTGSTESADLLLLIDVFEHVEDYLGFLRKLASRACWFVFHIPLDMHISGLLRDRQLNARQRVGHLHYFSRATALATLEDTGYRIVDHQFTSVSQETIEGRRTLTKFANAIRRGVQAISPNMAAKLLGGYSLLVLARSHELPVPGLADT